MNQLPVFDSQALQTTLGLTEAEVLVDFFDVFLHYTCEKWQELASACEAENFAKVRDISHSLKSSSHSVGALRLSRYFAELEMLALSSNPEQCRVLLQPMTEVIEITFETINNHLATLRTAL